MKPQYCVIRCTNPTTGIEETSVRKYKKEDYQILQEIAKILQVNDNVFKYRLQSLGIISW